MAGSRPGRGRARGTLGGCIAVAALLLTPHPGAAGIENDGFDCNARINGVIVDQLSDSDVGDAVSVPDDAPAHLVIASQEDLTYAVNLEYLGGSDDAVLNALHITGGQAYNAALGTHGAGTFTVEVKVNNYARYGLGVYRVVAILDSSNGHGRCVIRALIRVEGNPFTTVAGDAAAALGLAGLAGTAVAGAGAAGGGGGGAPDPPPPVEDPVGEVARRAAVNTIESPPTMGDMFGCIVLPLLLLAIAVVAMVGPGMPGAAGAPVLLALAAPPLAFRPVRWRPRISLVSLAGGLASSLGVVVLLQQDGRLFLTGAVLYRALLAGLAWGLLVPSVARLVAVRRVNRRLAARAAAAAAAMPPPALSPAASAPPHQTGAAAPWQPTAAVAAAGQPAWTVPDPSAAPVDRLPGGLPVRVEESSTGWARVTTATEASFWVDANLLEPPAPPA